MSIQNKLKQLPRCPGIYLYYHNKELIYVGKATNLKSRVRSYFIPQSSRFQPKSLKQSPARDFSTRSSVEMTLGVRPIETFISEVTNIKWIKTDSVLEAIILEANYIKKYQPKYNVLGKDDKSWNYIVIMKDEYPQVRFEREQTLFRHPSPRLRQAQSDIVGGDKLVFGPYPGLNAKAMMKILRQLFSISTCKPNNGAPCFYYQIKQCLGVCTGEITSKEYKQKVIKPLIKLLTGKKKQLLSSIRKQMAIESKNQNFEEAGRLRDQLVHLQKIQDVTLLNSSFTRNATLRQVQGDIQRIEGYDISNLGATGKVGSMVVFTNGEPDKSQYRKFKIRTVAGQSDVDCLKEVLARRLKHAEWPMPDIFLIDGGKPQVNTANAVLTSLPRSSVARKATVIGIAKGPERKKNEFHIIRNRKNIDDWFRTHKEILIRVRDEAHRFAVAYQRTLRKIK